MAANQIVLKITVLIDGGFFQKRYPVLYGKGRPAKTAVDDMWRMAVNHTDKENSYLYRILYYDCPPLDKKSHYPVSNASIDFGKSAIAKWKNEFIEELKRKRKVAIRLGRIQDSGNWLLHPKATKDLLGKKERWKA